jgi:hypothetical protein
MPDTEIDRDDRGRFATGSAGGPGRPRRRIETDYLTALSDRVSMDAWSQIVGRAIEDAIAGDAKAREWLSRHLLPTPSAGALPLHDAAVEALTGVSKVDADAETAQMHRLTLAAFRALP